MRYAGIFSLIFALGFLAYAGTNNLPTETARTIQYAHINKFKTALSGDLVPRNSDGTVTTAAASIGSSTYKFLKGFFLSGQWAIGDIKAHVSYNGTFDAGEGWMLCDGRIVTEANYNTEHGAAHFATYVGSTTMLNKYLPNLTGRYPVGAATTPQDGTVAFTATGNASNQINIAHTHDFYHMHMWYQWTNSGTSDNSFDVTSGVSAFSSSKNVTGAGYGALMVPHTSAGGLGGVDMQIGTAASGNIYTSGPVAVTTGASSQTTTSAGSATQSIQPDSIAVLYYMRIIQ